MDVLWSVKKKNVIQYRSYYARGYECVVVR